MTTVRSFAAGIALIRDEFVIICIVIAGGPILDMLAWVNGQIMVGDRLFWIIQPAYGWFYAAAIIAAIVRFAWFFLNTIQRVDYGDEFGF